MMDELKRPPLVEEGAGGDDAEIDALPEFDGGRRECFLMVLTVRQMCGLAWTAAQGHTNFQMSRRKNTPRGVIYAPMSRLAMHQWVQRKEHCGLGWWV